MPFLVSFRFHYSSDRFVFATNVEWEKATFLSYVMEQWSICQGLQFWLVDYAI